MSTWLRRHAPDLGMLAYIAALVLARSWRREFTVDVHVWDETWYLSNGVHLWARGLPPPDWAPLYAVWYWIESLFIANRLALYYANWSALLFLNLLAAWLIMRRLHLNARVSVLLLGALAVAGAFEIALNVTMLASALVGFGVAFALGRKTLSQAFAVAASFVAFATYVRPELLVAVVALVLMSIVACVVERRQWAVIPVAIAALLVLVLGSPLGNGSRTFLAFGQHYAINANASVSPDRQVHSPMTVWRGFVDADFGPVNTLGEAIRASPRAFLWHLGQNAQKLLFTLAAPITPVVPGGMVIGWLLFLTLIVGLIATVRARSRPTLVVISIAASTVGAEAIGALLVSPNPQYLMIPVLAVLGAALSAPHADWSHRNDCIAAVAAGLIVVVLPGHAGAAPWYLQRQARTEPPNLNMVRAVEPLRALTRGFPLLGERAQVGIYSDWESIPVGLPECPVLVDCIPYMGAIIMDGPFMEFYSNDPMLPLLLTRPGRVGFGDRRELAPGIVLVARSGVLGRP